MLLRASSLPLFPSVRTQLLVADQSMHPLFARADGLSREVIGAAIEVHRTLGPGLIESVYERCLLWELGLRKIRAAAQKRVKVVYKDHVFEEDLRLDLLVEDCLLVEIKAVRDVLPVHKAQVLSSMKLLDVPLGLIVDFHELRLVDGLSRLILPDRAA